MICLSGCFSAVRYSALDKVKDEWFKQTFFGQKASYGDDRALTTLLLKHGYNTLYAPDAKAKKIVPSMWKKFWRQQMRWEKSYIRETLIGLKFMWRRPLAAFEYYIGAFVTWAGFAVAAYTILFRPIFTHRTFLPWFYIVGLTIVSFLSRDKLSTLQQGPSLDLGSSLEYHLRSSSHMAIPPRPVRPSKIRLENTLDPSKQSAKEKLKVILQLGNRHCND